MAIGAEGDNGYDYDFLSSIEICIVDQADVFLMQNWQHVLHIFRHLNLVPRQSHGVDFGRVRLWSLNGRGKFYRQTCVFSSVSSGEMKGLFNPAVSQNYAGKLMAPYAPAFESMSQIVVQLPQAFQRFFCANPSDEAEARFEFFKSKILPQIRSQTHVLIYIPSYYDYVRVRNYFKREDIGFCQVCEYSKSGKIARARDMFFHAQKNFLLLTERFHFYRRYLIKGIRNLVFYQLPTYSHFYSEFANMIQDSTEYSITATVMYCQLDALRLTGVVGYQRAKKMLAAKNSVHMLVTGE